MPAPTPTAATAPELHTLPGYLIRRLQQIAVAIFLEETAEAGITPVQFAALQAVQQQPGIDQRTLAGSIGFDTSTLGGVIDRLEKRGLMRRNASPDDRRVRRLTLTPEGEDLLAEIVPQVERAQARILKPLSATDRKRFMQMLAVLVEANNEFSRAPSMAD